MKRNILFKTTMACSLIACVMGAAHAESLFRAGIAYQSQQQATPRSLFAVPRPTSVGDLITVNINDISQTNVQNNSVVGRQQEVTENSTGFFNDIIDRVFKRKPGSTPFLPSPDGVNNDHQINVTARTQKQVQFRDAISCQVVQVLPNGNLVIQGRKSLLNNQEQQTLYLSGIVNPFYLDPKNSISSQQVANLQMSVSGKGPMTRQSGDGVIGKYFQFLN